MSEKVSFSSWLQGIANAIRAKKGTNEPIKPLNFASEIEGIQAGEGSFGDGTYMKVLKYAPIGTISKHLFSHNNQTYLATASTTATSGQQTTKIYRYDVENDVYIEEQVSGTGTHYFAISHHGTSFELNGVHYFVKEKYITTWDGNTNIEYKYCSGMPFGVYKRNAFTYDGKMYLLDDSYGQLVEYDYDNDTYTTIVQRGNSSSWMTVCDNGKYYHIEVRSSESYNAYVYKFNGTNLELLNENPIPLGYPVREYFMIDNILYIMIYDTIYHFVRFNILTNEMDIIPYRSVVAETNALIIPVNGKLYWMRANTPNEIVELFV